MRRPLPEARPAPEAPVIGYTPAGFPVTAATPACRRARCGQPGVHDGLCGPHWWQAAVQERELFDDADLSLPSVARCASAILKPGDVVTARTLELRLRHAWPWTWPADGRLRRLCAELLERAAAAGALAARSVAGWPAYEVVAPAAIGRCCDA